jgi:hypothetical protein
MFPPHLVFQVHLHLLNSITGSQSNPILTTGPRNVSKEIRKLRRHHSFSSKLSFPTFNFINSTQFCFSHTTFISLYAIPVLSSNPPLPHSDDSGGYSTGSTQHYDTGQNLIDHLSTIANHQSQQLQTQPLQVHPQIPSEPPSQPYPNRKPPPTYTSTPQPFQKATPTV